MRKGNFKTLRFLEKFYWKCIFIIRDKNSSRVLPKPVSNHTNRCLHPFLPYFFHSKIQLHCLFLFWKKNSPYWSIVHILYWNKRHIFSLALIFFCFLIARMSTLTRWFIIVFVAILKFGVVISHASCKSTVTFTKCLLTFWVWEPSSGRCKR